MTTTPEPEQPAVEPESDDAKLADYHPEPDPAAAPAGDDNDPGEDDSGNG